MKIIFAITIISSVLSFGCGSPANNANNANNAATNVNANTIAAPIGNNSNVNNANKSASPDTHVANINTANSPKSKSNANPTKQKTDSLVENVNKRADAIVNNQTGAVKKFRKNVDKLIKDLP